MPQTLRPLGDRVLVRRHEEKATNKSGLQMPAGATEKPMEGTIVAVGNGRKLDNGSVLAVDLKEGQRVVFGKFAGSEFTLNGETLLLMREDEVMGEVAGEPDIDTSRPGSGPPNASTVAIQLENINRKKKRKRK